VDNVSDELAEREDQYNLPLDPLSLDPGRQPSPNGDDSQVARDVPVQNDSPAPVHRWVAR
jgi:hypothetical protein